MKRQRYCSPKLIMLCSGALVFGILPGCVEIAILKFATPFLLGN